MKTFIARYERNKKVETKQIKAEGAADAYKIAVAHFKPDNIMQVYVEEQHA